MQNYRVFLINKITLWFNVEHPFKEKKYYLGQLPT